MAEEEDDGDGLEGEYALAADGGEESNVGAAAPSVKEADSGPEAMLLLTLVLLALDGEDLDICKVTGERLTVWPDDGPAMTECNGDVCGSLLTEGPNDDDCCDGENGDCDDCDIDDCEIIDGELGLVELRADE